MKMKMKSKGAARLLWAPGLNDFKPILEAHGLPTKFDEEPTLKLKNFSLLFWVCCSVSVWWVYGVFGRGNRL